MVARAFGPTIPTRVKSNCPFPESTSPFFRFDVYGSNNLRSKSGEIVALQIGPTDLQGEILVIMSIIIF